MTLPDLATFSRKLVDELRFRGSRSANHDPEFPIGAPERGSAHRTGNTHRRSGSRPIPRYLEDGRWTAGLRLGDYGGSVPALVAASGADIWSPDRKAQRESVRDAHDRGLSVVPWTVNEPKDIDAMRGPGVDGVISIIRSGTDADTRGVPS